MSGLFRRLAERACGQRQPLLHARVLPAFLADAQESLIEDPPLPLTTPLPAPPLPLETAVAPALSQPATQPSVIHHEQPLATPPVAAPQTPADVPMAHTHPQTARPGTEPNSATERASSPSRQPAAEQAPPQPDTSLLMPTTPRTDSPRPALTAFNPPPTAAPPDEIHVHIGRIEVTAVRDSAPAKPSARTPQPTLSLDAYLAKRKGQPSRGEPS